MRRLCCFLITIISLPGIAFAQVTFSGSTGYGTYAMEELKANQKELQGQFPVDAKITSSFPGYWYFEFGASYYFKSNFFIGSTLSYGSTGGKIHYRDYSGEIGLEHKVKYFAVGVPVGYRLRLQPDKMNLQFELSPAIYFGNTQLDFETKINAQEDQQTIEFKSTNIGLRPAVRLDRKVGPALIFIQCGFFVDLYRSKLTFKDDSEYYLQDENGAEVHADFSGLRAAIGVAFELP